MVNYTNQLYEVTSTCFDWCKEQAIIHQGNIDISNLGVVAVAMASLIGYQVAMYYQDKIMKRLEWNAETFKFYINTFVVFAFMLLAVFLIYYAWVN